MTCNELDLVLESYLRGDLDLGGVSAVETHAAGCTRCERLLDARTAVALSPLIVAPPAEVRPAVLSAIREARWRRGWRRAGGLAAVAAAAIMLLMAQPNRKRASDVPGGASILLAAERARPEFAALDQAARELEAALRAQPNDPELQAFLASVHARRAALSRLIRDAAS